MQKLPPLSSVRVFEAAARLNGFTAAAEALNLTPAAVAHHVKQLEQWLNMPLFVRHPRKVELTPFGLDYYNKVSPLLVQLATVSEHARRTTHDELTVTSTQSFVSLWLMPRLEKFRALCPSAEVRLLGATAPVDFVRDQVDIAIRLGAGPYPGLHAECLFSENFYVVGSPALLGRQKYLTDPVELAKFTLLHDEFEPRVPHEIDWPQWLSSQKWPQGLAKKGLRFSHSYLSIEAAASGQGLALAADVMVQGFLKTRRLAIASAHSLRSPYSYWLITPPGAIQRPAVKMFVEWIRKEAKQEQKKMRAYLPATGRA